MLLEIEGSAGRSHIHAWKGSVIVAAILVFYLFETFLKELEHNRKTKVCYQDNTKI